MFKGKNVKRSGCLEEGEGDDTLDGLSVTLPVC